MAKETARIACRVPNGLTINLWRPSDARGPFPEMVKDGPTFTLKGPSAADHGGADTQGLDAEPGITEVPAAWADKWFEQNREINPLVAQGMIYRLDDEPEKDQRFVDGERGDDQNDGLTPGTAKQTIQGAFDSTGGN